MELFDRISILFTGLLNSYVANSISHDSGSPSVFSLREEVTKGPLLISIG